MAISTHIMHTNIFTNTSEWVIASHNMGKIKEVNALLSPFGLCARSAYDLGLPEPDETGQTFAENAALKAKASAKASQMVALADDSGLCVEALDGAPGIYSARWAGKPADFQVAIARIKNALEEKHSQNFSAKFVCVLALTHPKGETRLYEGAIKGRLSFPPRGKNGFGYDPIFIPEGESESFAQMDPQLKYTLSHRAKAFERLKADIFCL